MDPTVENDMLAERLDEANVRAEILGTKLDETRAELAVEKDLADKLALALYTRGFTGNQIDALAAYEATRHA